MKVGDYCYIKGISRDYGIGKITQLNSGYSSNGGELIDIQFKHSKHSVPKKDVISSPNIIDLIENVDQIKYRIHGDIYYGTVETETIFGKCIMGIWYNKEFIELKDLDIVSIVTHEQFESMQYNLESEVNYIMKITIYELIGLIKDKKQPLKIKFEDKILNYDEKCQNYEFRYDNSNEDGSLNWDYLVFNCLNEYVEILESQV